MIRERVTSSGCRAWEVVDTAGRVLLDTLDREKAVQYDAELQPGAGPWLLQACYNHSSIGRRLNRWDTIYRAATLIEAQGAYKSLKLNSFVPSAERPNYRLDGVWRILGPAGGERYGLGWYPGDPTEYPPPREEGWVR